MVHIKRLLIMDKLSVCSGTMLWADSPEPLKKKIILVCQQQIKQYIFFLSSLSEF